MGDITLSLRSLSGDEGAKVEASADLFKKRREQKVEVYRYGSRSEASNQGSSE
jgi:Flp pilus assembly protein CpaB